MSREDSIQAMSQHIVDSTADMKESMAVIITMATALQTILNNPEIIRIVATAIVDVQEQLNQIKAK